MIQSLRNTLSAIFSAGAISFALTSVVAAQGLKTNQEGSFGSGWQVGNSSSETSPYTGTSGGSSPSPGYGGSSSSGYNAPAGQGGYGGSSAYGSARGSYGSSGSQSSTTTPEPTGSPSSPRSAGGGLRVQ